MFQKHLEKKGEVYICRHATSCTTKRRTELINGLLRLGHMGPRDLFCHIITEEELIFTYLGVGNRFRVLFSDLALWISLNFTWNWSIRLYNSSNFNNVYRYESCRRYSWTWPIGFWRRGMQIKGKNQQIHGLYRGLIYSSTTMWHYSEDARDVHIWLMHPGIRVFVVNLRFRKNNGRSNTAEIRRLWQSVRSPPILKES